MGKFNFEKCIPDEYYYSLELLENIPSYPNHEDFLNYIEEELIVEYVYHYKSWVFFIRKRTLVKFILFSDAKSKIYYFRIFTVITLISFAILNILSSPIGSVDEIFALLLILIAIIVLAISIPTSIKYIKLKKSDES